MFDACEVDKVKQYCRYCAHALDYNGEGEDFICLAEAPCGNNGAGQFYKAEKAKRVNHCKNFDFINADIFRRNEDESFAEYKPREETEKLDQISFDMIGSDEK